MSTTQKPEALRLAEHLEKFRSSPDDIAAASEIRYQHALLIELAYQLSGSKARIAELEAQLSAIGAGGVEPLRKRAAPAVLAAQEENQVDKIFDAVLNCPHSITHESVTLHFYPRQKEGHNALSQLRHRLAAYDLAARQREMQLLSEIEALERLALNVLKQHGAEATPIAWYVTGCSTMLDEHDAKAEAKRCGGSAKAVPLYTRPVGPETAHLDDIDVTDMHQVFDFKR